MGHQRDESKKKIVGARNDASLRNLFLTPVQIKLNLLTFRDAGRLLCLMSLAFERNEKKREKQLS